MEKIKKTFDNINLITNFLTNYSFKDLKNLNSLLEFISKKFDMQQIFFEFFHPYYFLMIKYDFCALNKIFFDKIHMNMISWFVVKNNEKTIHDLMSFLYCYVDEMCGLFIYTIDSSFFLTTQIEIQNKYAEEFLEINGEEINFLCVVSLIEEIGNKKKIIMKFNLYIVQNEKNNLLFTGFSKFQKPKNNLPMAHF